MKLQLQPDKASCFITSIAMVIGEPVNELIKKINTTENMHKKILHPGREGSMKYRGHHPQDFTEYLQSIGYCLVLNYSKIPIAHMYSGKKCVMCGGSGKFKGKWEESNLLIENNVGVLQYANHACAWDGKMVYDPNGKIYEFHTSRLIGFHPIYKLERNPNEKVSV